MKNERRELMYVVSPGLSTREPLHHGFTPMTTTCRHFLATSSLAPPKASIPSKVDTLTNNYCYIFIFKCFAKNAHSSATSSMILAVGFPEPCPALVSIRINTGLSPL